jgi:hypothetical protein
MQCGSSVTTRLCAADGTAMLSYRLGRCEPVAAVQAPNRQPVPQRLGCRQNGGIGTVFGIWRRVTVLTAVVVAKIDASRCVARRSVPSPGRPFSLIRQRHCHHPGVAASGLISAPGVRSTLCAAMRRAARPYEPRRGTCLRVPCARSRFERPGFRFAPNCRGPRFERAACAQQGLEMNGVVPRGFLFSMK